MEWTSAVNIVRKNVEETVEVCTESIPARDQVR